MASPGSSLELLEMEMEDGKAPSHMKVDQILRTAFSRFGNKVGMVG